MLAWSAAMGLGCRKNGCGVWCGDDRKTTRETLRARRATTAETVAGPAAQTKEDRLDPGQRRRQRIGGRESREDDLDAGRERRGRWTAHEGTDRSSEAQ
jgi:hypothetical protein